MLFIVSGIERPRAKCGMIAILWVKVLIFQGAKPNFNVGSLSKIRNDQSYAHDNDVLNNIEAAYVVKIITATLTLVHEIENQ